MVSLVQFAFTVRMHNLHSAIYFLSWRDLAKHSCLILQMGATRVCQNTLCCLVRSAHAGWGECWIGSCSHSNQYLYTRDDPFWQWIIAETIPSVRYSRVMCWVSLNKKRHRISNCTNQRHLPEAARGRPSGSSPRSEVYTTSGKVRSILWCAKRFVWKSIAFL